MFALQPEQVTGQADIVEIQLGGLDQPLRNVSEPRRKQEHDVTRLQQGHPPARRGMGYPDVAGEAVQVQYPPYPAGGQPDELLEEPKILDGEELPDVPFDVGREVISQCLRRVEVLVVDPWIKTGQKEAIDRERAVFPLQFGDAQPAHYESCYFNRPESSMDVDPEVAQLFATRRAILEHHEHFDGSGNLFDPEVAQLFTATTSTH